MSDHELDLSLVQIGVRVGLACAVTLVMAVGAFFLLRLLVAIG